MSPISSPLFFTIPVFLLFLTLALRPIRVYLLPSLIALLALLAATLGLGALEKAESIVKSFFVFALESSSLCIIYSISSYRLYVSALFLLLSSATLLSLLSALLPVPSAISPALLVLFSLLSFPILSHLIFPPKHLSPRGASLNSSRTSSRLTTSPSLSPFPSPAPSASSATIGAFSPAINPEKLASDPFFEVDLEGPSPPNHNNSSTTGTLSIVPALLLIAQFLFLFSSILDICATSSALKTVQTTLLVVSSLFTTFSYSHYVRNPLCVSDRIPEQATESCGSSNPTKSYAKGVYTNINSTNDATVPSSQHSLSPNASMSISLGSIESFHVNGQAPSKVTTHIEPTTGPVPLWIRTDDATIHHRAGTNRDGATISTNHSAANDINFIYMPTPVRILPPSFLFPDDNSMGAATMADLQRDASRQPTTNVVSDVPIATHLPTVVGSKKSSTLAHKHSTWSISSSSAISVPIMTSPTPTLSSSSSTLALSAVGMKPRSQTLSTKSLAKCVPLDVLSRKMEIAQNSSPTLQPNRKDRRDLQQAWLRVDNGISSRCRSISAASSLTSEDPEWVAGGKEKKRSGFIFGNHSQSSEVHQDKIQDDCIPPVHGSRSHLLFNRQGIPSIRRAMRGRSLSISLLSNLIKRRKSAEREEHDEDANEPISPSSSISVSRSSLLSSLSMSLSRSPASPTSPLSPRTPGHSEPGSPTSSRNEDDGSGKKNTLYYWTYRKVKKGVRSRAVSDLCQDTERERDNERVDLMVDEGPPDFMDLTDPFAPPDLGARGSMKMVHSADGVLLGENKSVTKTNMWGRLPLVAEQKKGVRVEACTVVKPKIPVKKKVILGPGEAERKAKIAGNVYRVRRATSIKRAKSGDSLSRAHSRSAPRCGLSGSRRTVLENGDDAVDRSRAKNVARLVRTVSKTKKRTRFCREGDHDRGGLDIEEALLAQKLLMKLDLAPGS